MPTNYQSPKVFVVIVTYNGEKWLKQCLDSLQKSLYQCSIIAIDNSSTDNTVNILKNYNLHLIKEFKNHGFGVANNIGISFALNNNADYIFLLNQDAFINENTISNLVHVAENNDSFALYSPIHLNESGNNFDSNFIKNYVIDSAPQYISDVCIKGKAKPTYPIHSINAAAWFVRSNTFRVVGGFDPIFFMYGEDNDFSNRLKFHGLRCAIVPSSFIHHSRGTPPLTNTNYFSDIIRRAKRIRANALAKIKNPNKKFTRNSVSCFVSLLFSAINELLYCLSFKEFSAHSIGIIYLLLDLKKTIKHREMCMTSKGIWVTTLDKNRSH